MAYIEYNDGETGSSDWSQVSEGDILLLQDKRNPRKKKWAIVSRMLPKDGGQIGIRSREKYRLVVCLEDGMQLDPASYLITSTPGVPGCDVILSVTTTYDKDHGKQMWSEEEEE